MFAKVFAWLLGKAGGGVLERVLGHLERKADSETERLRIRAAREQNAANNAAKVITTGMQFKVFWIPWLIAAVPVSLWFGWGVLDSLTNGALPDVAELPPQLLRYADTIFGNIFYSGAGMAGVQAVATIVRGRK